MWLTIVAAAMASSTAIIIATVVHSWQKRMDRKVELSKRKVDAYSEFLTVASSAFSLLTMAHFHKDKSKEALDDVDLVLHGVRSSFNTVALLSDDLRVHESFSALQFNLWAYRGHLRHELLDKKVHHRFLNINGHQAALKLVKESYGNAMLSAKRDIGDLSVGEARKILEYSRILSEVD